MPAYILGTISCCHARWMRCPIPERAALAGAALCLFVAVERRERTSEHRRVGCEESAVALSLQTVAVDTQVAGGALVVALDGGDRGEVLLAAVVAAQLP
jgi:hypothetical protein